MWEGYRQLAAAILLQAIADLTDRDPAMRADAARFLRSDWYALICEALGLAPLPVSELQRRAAGLIGRTRRRRPSVGRSVGRADRSWKKPIARSEIGVGGSTTCETLKRSLRNWHRP